MVPRSGERAAGVGVPGCRGAAVRIYTASMAAPTPPIEDTAPRPPSITAFLAQHPAYVLLGLTLWSLLISLYYIRAYLEVFQAEPSWFSQDPLQLAAVASEGYAKGLVVLALSALLVPRIRLRRWQWIGAYVCLIGMVLASLSRPLFSLDAFVWTRSLWVFVAALSGLLWIVSVPVLHHMLGMRREGQTVQALLLDTAHHDNELRWAAFGLPILGMAIVFALAVGIGQTAGWDKALRTRIALEDSHATYVEFLGTVDAGGHELDAPHPVTEHVVFSDGHRQLVAHMSETSIWVALEEGDTVIDPCVTVLKGGVVKDE